MTEYRIIRPLLTALLLLLLLALAAAPAEALSVKLMKYDLYPANAGEYVTVRIKIENLGGSPMDMDVGRME